MKTMFAALAIALPAVAYAQAAPAPAPSQEKMQSCCEKMDCHDKNGEGQSHHDGHAGHDVVQHQQHQKPNQ